MNKRKKWKKKLQKIIKKNFNKKLMSCKKLKIKKKKKSDKNKVKR